MHPVGIDELGSVGAELQHAIKKKTRKDWKGVMLRNACHYNALRVCAIAHFYNINIHYVTGEVSYSTPESTVYLIHSWNYIPSIDAYIDLTFEAFADLRSDYMLALSKPVPELLKERYDFKGARDIYTQWLNRQR